MGAIRVPRVDVFRRYRRGGVVLVWALVVAFSAAPAVAQGSGGGSGFSDVAEDAFYAESVSSLAGDGVFSGTECDEGFCPGDVIDRKTSAVWLVRVLDGSDPVPVADSGFSDVDADGFHAPFVKRLADLGVTGGCGDGSRFCGDRAVTRAQMAVFLSRAFSLADGPDPGFADVPSGAWYAADVARLAAARVTAGCGDGTRFCPDRETTRAQMATFIARADGRVALPEPPAEPLAPAALAAPKTPAGLQGAEVLSVSPDHSRVVYHQFRSWLGGLPYGLGGDSSYSVGIGSLYVANADGTGLELVSGQGIGVVWSCYDGCGDWSLVRWSPDSRHFTYGTQDGSGKAALYLASGTGGSPVKVEDIPTEQVEGVHIPSRSYMEDFGRLEWSPDSRRLAYRSSDEDGKVRLFVAAADGTGAVHFANDARDWSWSPDGRHIAYWASGEDGSRRLFVAPADGMSAVALPDKVFVYAADGTSSVTLPVSVYSYRWSPDGRYLAYILEDEDGSRNRRLFVAAADGTGAVHLAKGLDSWSWSPDGRYVSYISHDEARNNRLYVAAADGTSSVQLADDIPPWEGWSWSPDGRRIAYTPREQVENPGSSLITYRSKGLFIAAADGTGAIEVARGVPSPGLLPDYDLSPWSPDGRYLAYTSYEDGKRILLVTTADGAENVRASDNPWLREPAVVWAPEGGRVAFAEPPRQEKTYLPLDIVVVTIAGTQRAVIHETETYCFNFRGWTAAGIEIDEPRACSL